MKIDDINGRRMYNSQATDIAQANKGVVEESFSQAFDNAAGQNAHAWVENMLENIKEQGQKLENQTDLTELLRYKRMITELLNVVTMSVFQFSSLEATDVRGRRRKYSLIRLINEKLELITRQFLEREKNHISLLNLIGEIEGLLVDLIA